MGALFGCFRSAAPPLPPNAATREQIEPLVPPIDRRPPPPRQMSNLGPGRPPGSRPQNIVLSAAPGSAPGQPGQVAPRRQPGSANGPARGDQTAASVDQIMDSWSLITSRDPNVNVFLRLARDLAAWREEMMSNHMSEAEATMLACGIFEKQLKQLNIGHLINEQDEMYLTLVKGGKQVICGGAPPVIAPLVTTGAPFAGASTSAAMAPDAATLAAFYEQSGMTPYGGHADTYEDDPDDEDDGTGQWPRQHHY